VRPGRQRLPLQNTAIVGAVFFIKRGSVPFSQVEASRPLSLLFQVNKAEWVVFVKDMIVYK
jgi:hypothetical protein